MFFSEIVARLIAKETNLEVPLVLNSLEYPENINLGDIAFPCFILAKKFKSSPGKIAFDLANKLKPDLPIDNIVANGPYINFFINKALFAEYVLKKKNVYPNRKEKIMVEHSNGNTHKAVHIGHLRNMFLGDSIVRLLRMAGHRVVNSFYINDTGMHVAKCLWALKNFYSDKISTPPDNKLSFLGEVYSKGASIIDKDKDAKLSADKLLSSLENEEKDILSLWKLTRQWSIDGWHKIFDLVEILPFDAKFYDSDVSKDVPLIISSLQKKGILELSEGALIANLERFNLGVAIIKKSDGTTPYIAKDLALAKRKFSDFKIDASVYVVGSEQELHFQQLFKILDLFGFAQSKRCFHLSYGLVMLSSGKISSRLGSAPPFDEFYSDVFDHSLNEVKKRHSDWSDKKQLDVAKAICLSAIKFPMVLQEPNKNIIFDIRKALDFEGETGPYVLYAYARLCSVISKFGKKISDNVDFGVLVSSEEVSLLKLLDSEQGVVLDAAKKYRPSLIAHLALNISQAVNTFYHAQKIISSPTKVMRARLFLVLKARDSLGRLLTVLGINPIEKM